MARLNVSAGRRSASHQPSHQPMPWHRAVALCAELTAWHKAILMAISCFDWDGRGLGCVVGIRRLAAAAGMSERKARTVLAELVASGLVLRRRRGRKAELTDVLRLHRPKLAALAPAILAAPRAATTDGSSGTEVHSLAARRAGGSFISKAKAYEAAHGRQSALEGARRPRRKVDISDLADVDVSDLELKPKAPAKAKALPVDGVVAGTVPPPRPSVAEPVGDVVQQQPADAPGRSAYRAQLERELAELRRADEPVLTDASLVAAWTERAARCREVFRSAATAAA